MTSIEDVTTAHGIIKVIKKVARDEINKSRPAASYAVVTSINPDDSSCTVLFPGGVEGVDDVRAVYTSTAPAEVGQTVRIGGSVNDRYIEAVLGTSSDTQRIADLETQVADLQTRLAAAELLVATIPSLTDRVTYIENNAYFP